MVNIAPFRALRYKANGDLSRLVCPPYDVISEGEQKDLASLSPHNFVNVELPLGNPEDRARNAGSTLALWKQEGVFQRDGSPAFYVLESRFKVAGSDALHRRLGFFCALGLEEPGKGSIHPHERTLPKPKAERLNMLETLKTNTSPIFGFFMDEERSWLKAASSWAQEKPLASAREISGVEHRLWAVTDAARLKVLSDLLKGKEIYIADGHHRYEVGWTYHSERLRSGRAGPGSGRILAYLCAMEDPGLVLLPIHRYLRTPLPQNEWNARLRVSFDARPVDSLQSLLGLLDEARKAPERRASVGLYAWGQHYLLQLRRGADNVALKTHYPEPVRELDAVILEAYLFPETRELGSHPGWEVRYTNNAGELKSWVDAEAGGMGFLLAPTGIDQVAAVAKSGNVMPPKTTFFYPKAPAGFVLYELGGSS